MTLKLAIYVYEMLLLNESFKQFLKSINKNLGYFALKRAGGVSKRGKAQLPV